MSFKALKTVEGVVHPIFQAAFRTLALLEDDTPWDGILEEASIFDSPYKIRELYAIMIVCCHVGYPIYLWKNTRKVCKKIFEGEWRERVEILSRSLILLTTNVLSF
ncbi:hypothetical protein NPIL_175601 [Nephila pilipes]|uniref:Uncharacterized protein n=1 Tax=Nephila pilipes TaxID=299642 RepID=A0A8X6QMV5_NEPPI|nr:hypothetical protein NPIL_175601 [Nephila pilipes]